MRRSRPTSKTSGTATQTGAGSPAYEPGPYMKSEYQVEAFINWYTQRMQEHLA